jgi:hypothetical protein
MYKRDSYSGIDNTVFGLILGLMGPGAGFCIYYLIRFLPQHVSFGAYANQIFGSRFLVAPVLSLCIIVNAVLFFLFIRLRKDLTSKGILVSTILYGCVIVVLKFL